MKHSCPRIFVLLLALCLVIAPAALAETREASENIIALNLAQSGAASVQAWIDGALTDTAGKGAEWYIITLHQRGSYDFSSYRTALQTYLDQARVSSASSRLKFALALAATGGDDASVTQLLDESIGKQGVMSWVYGLHLMRNGYAAAAHTPQDVVDKLLSLRLEDGGWAVSGKVSDVDVTAMVLQALAPWRSSSAVQAAVDQAVLLLSQRQAEDGGFSSYGTPNPESSAQVLTALSALGLDGLKDERFIKNGCTLMDAITCYRLPDGSYSHTLGGSANANATVQVLLGLTAYERLLSGKADFYLLDPPAASPAEPVPDSRTVIACVILALALIACIVLTVMKKRHWKNYLAVLILTGALLALVFTVQLESAESYYNGQAVVKENSIGSVTLTVRCDSVAGKAEHIPSDGVMFPTTAFPIAKGDTVFTVLTDAARSAGLRLDNSGAQGMAYISGINGLYEFDWGDLSGWTYLVNGETPSTGCDHYQLADGDVIEWHYTLTVGRAPEIN